MEAFNHPTLEQIDQKMRRTWNWNKPALQPLRSLERHSVTTTGYAPLDHALGINGIPNRAIVALYGQPVSGLTSLAYRIIASAQKAGRVVIYLDVTQTFDPELAVRDFEVNPQKFEWVYPDNLAQALELARDLVGMPYVGMVVVDGALLERDDSHALPLYLEKLRQPLKTSSWSCIVLLPTVFMEVSKSDAAIQILTQKLRWIEEDADPLGYEVAAIVLKNTLHPRLGKTTFSVLVKG